MVSDTYQGPLRGEPLAVELHNTLYAAGGRAHDGLDDERSARAWLNALGDRLPGAGAGSPPTGEELASLREAVREALRAAANGSTPPDRALKAINASSARAPRSPRARASGAARPVFAWNYARASRADVVIAAIAESAIELLTDCDAPQLRLCGAPGCVLLYAKQHPSQQWCSAACGNRARQARHYERVHERRRA